MYSMKNVRISSDILDMVPSMIFDTTPIDQSKGRNFTRYIVQCNTYYIIHVPQRASIVCCPPDNQDVKTSPPCLLINVYL